ncbi:unnamed protein product [Cylicocyclus nassatus]|uniref:Uncharacterized protein n=1 Tax=Cylicocyclus nassatus TaxID=53992 RepID=A0AA36H0D0_CYLNA|nr:unnamed protein product [Cylicocyclus nassatus]
MFTGNIDAIFLLPLPGDFCRTTDFWSISLKTGEADKSRSLVWEQAEEDLLCPEPNRSESSSGKCRCSSLSLLILAFLN